MAWQMSEEHIVVDAEFAERFRDLRLREKLTQKELSEKSGVSAQTISRIERLKKEQTWNPKKDTLGYIAGVYGMTLDEFLSSLSEQRPSPPKRTEQEIPQGECEVVAAEIKATDIQVIQVLRTGSWWQRRPEILRFSSLVLVTATLLVLVWSKLEGHYFTAGWYLERGIEAIHRKEYVEAEQCLMEANHRDPHLDSLNYHLGVLRFSQDKPVESVRFLAGVLPTDPYYLDAQRLILMQCIERQPLTQLMQNIDDSTIQGAIDALIRIDPRDALARLVEIFVTINRKDPKLLEQVAKYSIELFVDYSYDRFEYNSEDGTYRLKSPIPDTKFPTRFFFRTEIGLVPMILAICYSALGHVELNKHWVFATYAVNLGNAEKAFIANGITIGDVVTCEDDVCWLVTDVDSGVRYLVIRTERFLLSVYRTEYLETTRSYLAKAVSIPVPFLTDKRPPHTETSPRALLKMGYRTDINLEDQNWLFDIDGMDTIWGNYDFLPLCDMATPTVITYGSVSLDEMFAQNTLRYHRCLQYAEQHLK